MVPATQFTHPDAVEAWDSTFRWRTDGELRDVTIDNTWWRVAEAVAGIEGEHAPLWAHRYVDAFRQWRLLPDERLLRLAGTGQPAGNGAPLTAVLNVAAFIDAPLGIEPCFNQVGFSDAAALAVRLLDDAQLTFGGPTGDAGLRIGIVGFADALRRLRVSYVADEARTHAQAVARALAEGCLRGAVDLADERGPAQDGDDGRAIALLVATRCRERGMPEPLVERMLKTGVRHAVLTAIQPQPLLAALANCVSDGIDTLPSSMSCDGEGRIDAAYAAARDRIRVAMQPWIDLQIAGATMAKGRLTLQSPQRGHPRTNDAAPPTATRPRSTRRLDADQDALRTPT